MSEIRRETEAGEGVKKGQEMVSENREGVRDSEREWLPAWSCQMARALHPPPWWTSPWKHPPETPGCHTLCTYSPLGRGIAITSQHILNSIQFSTDPFNCHQCLSYLQTHPCPHIHPHSGSRRSILPLSPTRLHWKALVEPWKWHDTQGEDIKVCEKKEKKLWLL